MVDKSESNSTQKVNAITTYHDCTRPSAGRRERITSAFLNTVGQDTRVGASLGREIAESREENKETYGRYRRITVGEAEEVETGSEIGRIGIQAKITDRGGGWGKSRRKRKYT